MKDTDRRIALDRARDLMISGATSREAGAAVGLSENVIRKASARERWLANKPAERAPSLDVPEPGTPISAIARAQLLDALTSGKTPARDLIAKGFIGQPTEGLWAHLANTVLAEYVRNSALLCLGVGLGTLAIGAGSGWLVTMYRFPGQRLLNWALVLPLAMPAYVLAYAYTDFLQVSGPLQTTLRDMTGWGWRDYWFPNVRSLGGAVFVLTAAPTAPASRAWNADEALAYAKSRGWEAVLEHDFDRAIATASSLAATVLVTGSFHTVGDAMARLQVDPLAG